MLDPASARLLEKKLNDFHESKESLEKKLEENIGKELYIANFCTVYYFRDESNDIKEKRDIIDITPLTEVEAESIVNEVNNLKELPNVKVKKYQDKLEERIDQITKQIAMLMKSH
jgi:hypothetical protein